MLQDARYDDTNGSHVCGVFLRKSQRTAEVSARADVRETFACSLLAPVNRLWNQISNCLLWK